MSDIYFYQERGKTVGPFSADDIKRRIREGQIRVFDLLYRDGEPSWRMALEHPSLVSEFKSSVAGLRDKPWVCLQKKAGSATEFLTTGPFSQDEIREALQAGKISYSDYAWKDSLAEWKRIGSLEEFNPRIRQAVLPAIPAVPQESSKELLKNVVEYQRATPVQKIEEVPPEAESQMYPAPGPEDLRKLEENRKANLEAKKAAEAKRAADTKKMKAQLQQQSQQPSAPQNPLPPPSDPARPPLDPAAPPKIPSANLPPPVDPMQTVRITVLPRPQDRDEAKEIIDFQETQEFKAYKETKEHHETKEHSEHHEAGESGRISETAKHRKTKKTKARFDWGLLIMLVVALVVVTLLISRFVLPKISPAVPDSANEAVIPLTPPVPPPPLKMDPLPQPEPEPPRQAQAPDPEPEPPPFEKPLRKPTEPKIPSKQATELILAVHAGSAQPQIEVRTDATADYPVYVQIIGFPGQVTEGGAYYRFARVIPKGKLREKLDIPNLRLPQGKFLVRAEAGDIKKETKFSWGLNDPQFKGTLSRQRKTWASALWKERLNLFTLAQALEKQLQQALLPGKKFQSAKWEKLITLKRNEGAKYLMFDDWWELHNIAKEAKTAVTGALATRASKSRERLSAFSIWK